jgi:hypothetical protein
MSEQSLPAEARQFDFWIGDWDAVWGDNARGTNVVRAVLDNAVILENFDGRPGTPCRRVYTRRRSHSSHRRHPSYSTSGHSRLRSTPASTRPRLGRKAIYLS